jgi:hypothetical protein
MRVYHQLWGVWNTYRSGMCRNVPDRKRREGRTGRAGSHLPAARLPARSGVRALPMRRDRSASVRINPPETDWDRINFFLRVKNGAKNRLGCLWLWFASIPPVAVCRLRPLRQGKLRRDAEADPRDAGATQKSEKINFRLRKGFGATSKWLISRI